MSIDPVVNETLVHAPAHKVWRALTDPNEMRQWYFDVEAFKAEPGFVFQLVGEKNERRYPITCKVVEAVEDKKLSYTWNYNDFPADTLVTFELTPAAGNAEHTRIRLTHTGLDKISPQRQEVSPQSHQEGWDHIVGDSLKKHVEKTRSPLYVEKTIDIHAPSSKVWEVLTNPELSKQWIKEWWPEIGILESDWELGGTVKWKEESGEVGAEGIITTVEPCRCLRFSFKVNTPDACKEEDILYRIEEGPGNTKLSVSIGDFGDTPEHAACYDGADMAWDQSLPKIKQLAESPPSP